MKKFLLIIAGGIAAIVVLANLGSLIALAITAALLYLVFKQFIKTDGWEKVAWGTVGVVLLLFSISNIPAILAVLALYVIYLIYKNWNKEKPKTKQSDDPFVNFEKQWSDLHK
ncbi:MULTISPECIES: lmo0954 family membrane protein [Cytobacillus]|uniref:lmo0954 family membrane protein n=1 Tax=Cytobacillus TaxID=2675230 RepID=UPI001CD3CB84|nr:flagellar basal body rod protein [Cytobacillus kochii]MCA1024945.1 flagellar basal body rod protein [Cytobacillus kochii]MCM3324040.1 flagellar basal body rod protein [Cytobacillus kochii]MCM3346556.1 flagellar basal body rod protein [Cytobacillus kochii]MDM5206637.1 flagellar basal body rod protein [Cytobacillus kochii]